MNYIELQEEGEQVRVSGVAPIKGDRERKKLGLPGLQKDYYPDEGGMTE